MPTTASPAAPATRPRGRTTPQRIVRVFMYNGIRLEDSLPGRSPEAVRLVHATHYAAIATAKIDGPEMQGNEAIYTYTTQAGVNG